MEETQVSINEWLKKMWHVKVLTHNILLNYYSAIKKNKIFPFVSTYVDLEGIMLSEVNQRKANAV